jgi:hypothetical protein
VGSQTPDRTYPVFREAGGILLHPVALTSLALLILNDRLLKAAFPGAFTGKLSDVAGLVFFPVLLVAAWELATLAVRGSRSAGTVTVAVAAGVTAIVFALVKTLPMAADAFGWGLGAAQWALGLPGSVLLGPGAPPFAAARVIADPTDLVALPAVLVAAWIAASPARRGIRAA